MSNCICSFVKGIWSCIMGSLRMILFFGTLILLIWALISTVTLFSCSHDEIIDNQPRTPVQLKVYALNLSSIIIAILGVYGSFYRHHASLKVFAILATIHALLIGVCILYANSSDFIMRVNDEYIYKLKNYRNDYNWYEVPNDHMHRKPTLTWDNLQSLSCCGIDGPKDWDSFRPIRIPNNFYPRSCCAQRLPNQIRTGTERGNDSYLGSLCEDNASLFRTGCINRVEQIEKMLFIFNWCFVGFQFMLASLACCISNHGNSNSQHYRSTSQLVMAPNSTNFGSNQNSKLENYHAATIYPSLYQARVEQVAPPPRYGSLE